MQNNKYYIAHAQSIAAAQDICIQILNKYMKGSVFTKVLIVGKHKSDNFEQLQNSLWNNSSNIFPFVLADEKLSNISPLVCSNTLDMVNNPNIIIIYLSSIAELKMKNLEHNKTIYIIALDAQQIASDRAILCELNIQEIPECDFLAIAPSRPSHTNDTVKPTKTNHQPMNMNNTGVKKELKEFENALLFIKPSVMKRRLEFQLLHHLFSRTHARFVFGATKRVTLETWRKFYAEHENKPWFEDQCQFLSESYLMVLVVSGRDVIARIRHEIGSMEPSEGAQYNSIRFIYGQSISDNGIHCSDSLDSYEREKALIFPNSVGQDNKFKGKK